MNKVILSALFKKNQSRLENTSALFMPEFTKNDVIEMILPILPKNIQDGLKDFNLSLEELFEPLKSDKLIKQFENKDLYILVKITDLIIQKIGYMRFYINKSESKLI